MIDSYMYKCCMATVAAHCLLPTLIVAVLPPVLGPVMMSALVPGGTHMSTGTGGGTARCGWAASSVVLLRPLSLRPADDARDMRRRCCSSRRCAASSSGCLKVVQMQARYWSMNQRG